MLFYSLYHTMKDIQKLKADITGDEQERYFSGRNFHVRDKSGRIVVKSLIWLSKPKGQLCVPKLIERRDEKGMMEK